MFTPFFTPTTSRRARVYISGPMTGIPGNNSGSFNRAAFKLRDMGYAVCSPIETSEFLGDLTHEQYLRFDFHRVLEADFLIALQGWHDSKGARAEILMALRMGVKVFEWKSWADRILITENQVADAITSAHWSVS